MMYLDFKSRIHLKLLPGIETPSARAALLARNRFADHYQNSVQNETIEMSLTRFFHSKEVTMGREIRNFWWKEVAEIRFIK